MYLRVDFFKILITVVILCVPLGTRADENERARLYQASMHEASWSTAVSVFECTLTQSIPQFGEARFYHRAGESLQFRLDTFDRVLQSDTLSLSSVPPPWNFNSPQKNFGLLGLSATGNIELEERTANLLMAEMLTGMMPRLSGKSALSNFESVEVTLSPLRFQAAYQSYQRCSKSLLPANYAQINRSTIFWPSGVKSLNTQAMRLLDSIVLYSAADDSIVGFEIDSFTDTAGERRENLLIAEERAFLVTNYLIGKGIDSEIIATRAHGEREEYLIVNPEKSLADRNRNRRVNIVMLRGNGMITAK
jgi:outer membrane protein OmpA-like peptidoglycan-associated protein